MLRNYCAAGALATAIICGVGVASADPPPPWADPHYPDKQHGNCVGGQGGAFGIGWCDGEHYPDGSYWHQITGSQGQGTRPVCVVDNGTLQPPPAPPGGCGGNT